MYCEFQQVPALSVANPVSAMVSTGNVDVQASDADEDAPPGTTAAEEPTAAAPAATAASEPQKKLPRALLARLKQRGVLKEESAAANGTAATAGTSSSSAASVAGVSLLAVPAGSLPPGWQAAVDPTYNHPYWFNVSTGERRWTPPDGATAAAATAVTASGLIGGAAANNRQGDGTAIGSVGDAALPPGWKAAADPTTGVTYYYHIRLNTQQWERPQATAADAPGNSIAEASTAEEQKPFVASTSFTGAKRGYVFKKGPLGLGYYRCAYTGIYSP